MKLIALCTIWTDKGRVAPGASFDVTDSEGGNLIKRGFAREATKADAKQGDADAEAAAKAAAEADAKAKAEAEAKAKADAEAAATKKK